MMTTPKQSAKLVNRRIAFSVFAGAGYVVLITISLAMRLGVVPAVIVFTLLLPLPIAIGRVWLWRRELPHRRARASGHPASWFASAPPALAAQAGVSVHERRGDRLVPGRVSFAAGVLSWHPTKGRTLTEYPTELQWDSSWQRVLDRPWFLRVYGTGWLTLSRPGSEDAILWVFNARDFRRVTKTPIA